MHMPFANGLLFYQTHQNILFLKNDFSEVEQDGVQFCSKHSKSPFIQNGTATTDIVFN